MLFIGPLEAISSQTPPTYKPNKGGQTFLLKNDWQWLMNILSNGEEMLLKKVFL